MYLGLAVRHVFVLGLASKVIFLRAEGAPPLHLDNAAAEGHDRQFVHAHQLFATLSSEEFILFGFSVTIHSHFNF